MQNHAPIYGVEYQLDGGSPLPALHDHNVPCAVCHVSNRAAVLMIPAWHECPSQWILEYTGYLMTEYKTHSKATYECVDKDPESVPGSHANVDGGLFYHVEANCNGLHVHLMMLRKSSPVLCAPSEHHACMLIQKNLQIPTCTLCSDF